MKSLPVFIIIVSLYLSCGYAQETAKEDFEKLYEKLNQNLELGNYNLMFMDLIKFLDINPDYKPARSLLQNWLLRYYKEIRNNDEVIGGSLKYIKILSPRFVELYLIYYYQQNDEFRVQEVLSKITENPPDSAQVSFRVFLLLDPILNPDLYNQILVTIEPYLKFDIEPEKFVLYYKSGHFDKIKNYASKTLTLVPLYLLKEIDPLRDSLVYQSFFMPSLPTDYKSVPIDSLNGTQLVNLSNQYKMSGNNEAYLYLQTHFVDATTSESDLYAISKSLYEDKKMDLFDYLQQKVNRRINLADTSLIQMFYWAISCLHTGEIFRAGKFLDNVFTFSRKEQSAFFRSELEWWQQKGLHPEIIGKMLSNYFGSEYTPALNNPVNISNAPAKPDDRATKYGTYHALIIGVQNYKDTLIQDLENPINDGLKIGNILLKNYTFSEDNIKYLFDPTREEILNELFNLRNSLGPHDNLLIFYAGHGKWEPDMDQGYWIPSDADIGKTTRWISNADIRDFVKSIKTQHTLLITDACFSGAIFKERDLKFRVEKMADDVYEHPSRKAITSGSVREVPDKSVFIEWLIKKLEENDDKYLLAADLFYSIRGAVINNSINHQVPLYGPMINANDDDLGDFIFIRK